MPQQAVDQAAYRKHFSVDDHIFVVTQLIEKSREFNQLVWFVLIGYEKAFDSVEHPMLWRTLEDLHVPANYIVLLKRLYHKQEAYVQSGVASRSFYIRRGVRQGDPISALLFMSVTPKDHVAARKR